MSDDKTDTTKFRGSGERRRRAHTAIDVAAAKKRKAKSRKAAKVSRAARKKQR